MINLFKNKKGRAPRSRFGEVGFTLVETMVAVTILVVGTLGPLVIAAQGVASGGYAKDQIIAYYLAQEGVEYIRSIRDGNALAGLPRSLWLQGVDTVCTVSLLNPFGCKLDARLATLTACTTPGCPQMKVTNTGYYGYSGSPTIYTRTIKLLPGTNTDIQTIQVTMTWTSRGSARSLVLNEDLYNSN